MGLDLHLDAEQGRGDLLAEQRLVALVVGVRHERGAGGQQLGAGGLDVDLFAVFGEERVAVVGAGDFAVLELGLGHGGAERDIPQGGGLGHVRVAGGQVGQEGALGDGAGLVIDGPVGQVPVHGQAQGLEEVLEDLLVLDREFLAQLDEVPARDDVEVALVLGGLGRGAVAGVVGDRRIAAHAVVVLHAALGGQAVVVPAHGVEDVLAGHALVARQDVGLRVGEHVSDVEGSRRRGRGSVDRVDLLPGGVRVELVGPFVKPALRERLFQPLQGGLVRNVDGGGGGRVCTLIVFSHGSILSFISARYCVRLQSPHLREQNAAVMCSHYGEIGAGTFAIKRIYDDPADDDGCRVLVDRLWPRGVSKERAQLELWLKDVAPSPPLRKEFGHMQERFADFRAAYEAELESNPAVQTLRTRGGARESDAALRRPGPGDQPCPGAAGVPGARQQQQEMSPALPLGWCHD